MGNASERMIEAMEEKRNQKLAEYMGLTYDEFSDLDWDIDTEESNDGLVYNYIVRFSDNSPKEILDKISGLESNNCLWIPAPDFENL